MNARQRKILAMSLRNTRHQVVTSAEETALLLVQMSQDALDEIVRLLDGPHTEGTDKGSA